MTSCECAAASMPTIALRAWLSDTLSPRLQRASVPNGRCGRVWVWDRGGEGERRRRRWRWLHVSTRAARLRAEHRAQNGLVPARARKSSAPTGCTRGAACVGTKRRVVAANCSTGGFGYTGLSSARAGAGGGDRGCLRGAEGRARPMKQSALFIDPWLICNARAKAAVGVSGQHARAWTHAHAHTHACVRFKCDLLAHKLHALLRAHVLAKVQLAQAVHGLVHAEATASSGEVGLLRRVGARDFPRQQPVGNRDDLVARVHHRVGVGGRKGEHRAVLARRVVHKRQSVLHALLHLVGCEFGSRSRARQLVRLLRVVCPVAAKPFAVGARLVARRHDVAHDEHAAESATEGATEQV